MKLNGWHYQKNIDAYGLYVDESLIATISADVFEETRCMFERSLPNWARPKLVWYPRENDTFVADGRIPFHDIVVSP